MHSNLAAWIQVIAILALIAVIIWIGHVRRKADRIFSEQVLKPILERTEPARNVAGDIEARRLAAAATAPTKVSKPRKKKRTIAQKRGS